MTFKLHEIVAGIHHGAESTAHFYKIVYVSGGRVKLVEMSKRIADAGIGWRTVVPTDIRLSNREVSALIVEPEDILDTEHLYSKSLKLVLHRWNENPLIETIGD